MLPIDQLITPLTKDDVQASLYRILAATGLPVTSWQPGAVARTIVSAVSTVFAGFTETMAVAIRSGFLDLAEGEWLSQHARYVYGVDRIEATFATGEITLTNKGGGVFSFDPGDLIVRSPASNKSYTNTEAFSLGSLEANKKVSVRAIEAGAASTSAPGQITEFVTTLLSVSVTNEAAVVGLDGESDPALRQRCRDSLGALSPNGPRAAYEYWAKTARRPDGSPIGVTRVRFIKPKGDGTFTMYVASAAGQLAPTDLAIVDSVLQTTVVPICVTAYVKSAVTRPIPVTCDVWISTDSGMSSSDAEQIVTKKLRDFIKTLPIGGIVIPPQQGKVSYNALLGQIEASSEFIVEAKVTEPMADIVLAPNEVAALGPLTVNMHQVPSF